MRAILFGATGMIGQGVLRELLLDPKVTHVTAIGRSAVPQQHEKLKSSRSSRASMCASSVSACRRRA
jgi:predicted amino acid dehydrogenase